MFWASIMTNGRIDLQVFDRGTLTGQQYRYEILAQYVRLFRGTYRANFVFVDDNARPHRAQMVDTWIESEDTQRSGQSSPFTLIPSNMYGTPLDAQFQLQDQL